MLRSSANCTTICVCPTLDVDVMLSMPAIVENCFSSGVATVGRHRLRGSRPGSVAVTVIVGIVDVRQVAHRQLPVGDDPEEQDARP